MELYIVAGIILLISLFLILDTVAEKHRIRQREEALEYLLQITEKIYFYGRPVSTCLRKGVVSELFWSNLGDFSRPFGVLMLYALHVQGNDSAWLYWRHRPSNEGLLPERNSVLVTFRYKKKWWELKVMGRRLDEITFHQSKVFPSHNYSVWSYMKDVPRVNQILSENCTDPYRSYLAPDYYYINLPKDKFEARVEDVLRHISL